MSYEQDMFSRQFSHPSNRYHTLFCHNQTLRWMSQMLSQSNSSNNKNNLKSLCLWDQILMCPQIGVQPRCIQYIILNPPLLCPNLPLWENTLTFSSGFRSRWWSLILTHYQAHSKVKAHWKPTGWHFPSVHQATRCCGNRAHGHIHLRRSGWFGGRGCDHLGWAIYIHLFHMTDRSILEYACCAVATYKPRMVLKSTVAG